MEKRRAKACIRLLLKTFPKSYSEELGIDLKSKRKSELFKWFLASMLFGARISETIAKRTYKAFVAHKLLKPRAIKNASWGEMIDIMAEGGYVRYDGKTTRMLWGIAEKLLEVYGGKLSNIYKAAESEEDLKQRLQSFKGIGPVTVQIFLRELRGVWNVRPLPSQFTLIAAKNLGLIKQPTDVEALKRLEKLWKSCGIRGKSFANFETALLRLGKDYCRKGKCKICRLSGCCAKRKKCL